MSRLRSRPALALATLGLAAGFSMCSLAPSDADAPAMSVAVSGLGIEIVLASVALALAALAREPLRARLGLGPARLSWRELALLVCGTLGLSFALDGLLHALDLHDRSALAAFDDALANAAPAALAFALVGVGLAPGIAEELLCRGLVQRGLARARGPATGIVGGALLFGALHLEPIHGAFAAILGLYLGSAAWLARSTRAAIACHIANNLVAVTAAARLPDLPPPGVAATLGGLALAALCLAAVAHARRPLRPPGRADSPT